MTVYTTTQMTKAQIRNAIKRSIVLIHNKNHAPVPHSGEYLEGLNILTKMVGWPRIYQKSERRKYDLD